MCLYKRIVWDCGCPRGRVLWTACEHRGTPDCRRRFLLDRISVSMRCRNHQPLTLPALRPPRRNTTPRNQRTGIILRPVSGSGSSPLTNPSPLPSSSSPNTLFSPLSARTSSTPLTNGSINIPGPRRADDDDDPDDILALNSRVRVTGSPVPRPVRYPALPAGANVFDIEGGNTTDSDGDGGRNITIPRTAHAGASAVIDNGTTVTNPSIHRQSQNDNAGPAASDAHDNMAMVEVDNNAEKDDDYTVSDPSIYGHSQHSDSDAGPADSDNGNADNNNHLSGGENDANDEATAIGSSSASIPLSGSTQIGSLGSDGMEIEFGFESDADDSSAGGDSSGESGSSYGGGGNAGGNAHASVNGVELIFGYDTDEEAGDAGGGDGGGASDEGDELEGEDNGDPEESGSGEDEGTVDSMEADDGIDSDDITESDMMEDVELEFNDIGVDEEDGENRGDAEMDEDTDAGVGSMEVDEDYKVDEVEHNKGESNGDADVGDLEVTDDDEADDEGERRP
ncbi:hypothetical protein VTI74DRAFT_10644 [Chaetomium olivicolor]